MRDLVCRRLAVAVCFILCDEFNSQNGHEDAAGDSGAGRPDGHKEPDDERGQTNVVVEHVMRVSRPQPIQVGRTAALNQRRHCTVTRPQRHQSTS